MFNLESYITPILLSYVDKYVKDFKPADAQVSLWGGGVVLHNLILKTDVLQDEVSLPFTLVSSRIHELLISVPWTKIISEPIVVTIDTIECILSLRTDQPDEKQAQERRRSNNTQVVEAPPGYMQALVRRIVNNIAIRVHHLIVKYVHDDIVLSLNVKHVFIDSAGDKWEPAFADIDPNIPIVRRLVTLDDLTLCLDKTDSDGKIRFYQDPLLYRCHLAFRISTKLVSANTRRATDIDFQLRSEKLAWAITADQLQLLLRLASELTADEGNTATSPTKTATSQTSHNLLGNITKANSAEPARQESWSEWAWSWMPSWKDREGGFEGNSKPTPPVSFSFSAYLDKVSLGVKIMEAESNSRKRSRTFLELCATHAAVRAAICVPTLLHVKFGIRDLILKSVGKCSCGHKDLNCLEGEPTIYLSRKNYNHEANIWDWPQKDLKPEVLTAPEVPTEVQTASKKETPLDSENNELKREKSKSFIEMEIPVPRRLSKDTDDLWNKMSPLIYFHLSHERSPPRVNMNPFENTPKDFEYSDWEEECDLNIDLRPMDLRVCFGLIHRLQTIKQLVHVTDGPNKERPMQKLTVEECDALLDNLPQRRINLEIRDFRISFHPWDHSLNDRPTEAPVLLDVLFPQINLVVTAPLYPHRVCSAAGQLPLDSGPLYRGARLHIATSMHAIQVSICSPTDERRRPCARIDLRFVAHLLLYPEYFAQKQSVLNSYTVKIREVNISGSSARLHAAMQVISSLIKQRQSSSLRKTSLARDALEDEDRVALDITVEDLSVRGFMTHNTVSHIATLQSVRATVLQSLSSNEAKQAWLFSGPDIPTSTPFVRLVIQWCEPSFKKAVDHFGLWTEPAALCMDPLFIAWLSYKPYQRHNSEIATRISASSIHVFKKRSMVSSSSGRGATKSESNTEQVHVKTRSMASSSEPSEMKEQVSPMPQTAPQPVKRWWQGDNLLKLYERLRMMPISMDLGLMLVYVTTKSASAVDCATVRLAMEKHASHQEDVMVFCIGRWSLYSSLTTGHLWHSVNHDGPTYTSTRETGENKTQYSFPWKMTLADMSCYSLEAVVASEKDSTTLRSQLKQSATVRMRYILELVTTTVTLSVETKSILYRTFKRPSLGQRFKPLTKDELKIKYFTAGATFKPSTLKEFLRGPLRQKTEDKSEPPPAASNDETKAPPESDVGGQNSQTVLTAGPMVSLGFNLHADTPPVVLKIESDQVHLVAACLHCFTHVTTLAHQTPATTMTRSSLTVTTSESQAFMNRESEELVSFSDTSIPSEERSDLMTIFESRMEPDDTIKTFFYCQWVIGRATLVVATEHVKIALDIDDIISTVDLEELYNQVRIKIASTTIKQYEKSPNGQWTTGPLGGRVLEAREPDSYTKESQFLSITVTQTQISLLPPSWKSELHPKVLEKGPDDIDMMLEVYAIIAPLEIVILPRLLDNVMSIANSLTTQSFCTLTTKEERKVMSFIFPFFYVSSGGLRLFLACDMPDTKQDDTLILRIDRISVNPHPDNPICRRPVLDSDTGWNNSLAGNLEGRQYEVLVEEISIQSTNFNDLVTLEVSQDSNNSVSENPAHKWNQQVPVPTLTTILHPMSISFVLAPVLFVKGVIVCGSAFELNLTSDCALELSIDQLHLALTATQNMNKALKKRMTCYDIKDSVCPYAQLGLSQNTLQGRHSSDFTLLDFSGKSDTGLEQGVGNATLDSGVETATSRSTLKSSSQLETPVKKCTSVTFSKESYYPSDYLEIFVTMGIIEFSLYYMDDGSQKLATNRSRLSVNKKEEEGPSTNKIPTTTKVPLGRIKLYQPNLYYWKRKMQINLQGSLFNVWLGLEYLDENNGTRNNTILNTAQGYIDPDTEIPPALLTMKYTTASMNALSNVNYMGRGILNVDIERPIMLELSIETLQKISAIGKMIVQKITPKTYDPTQTTHVPVLYKLRRFMMKRLLDIVTIQTSQFGLNLSEGTLGFEVMSLQVAWRGRPETILIRGLIHALVISCGQEQRIPIMQPVHVGTLIEAIWEAWRRVEGLAASKEPTVLFNIDLDGVVFDIQPDHLCLIEKITDALKQFKEKDPDDREESEITAEPENRVVATFNPGEVSTDHYYKDDLRSGAFKIEFGSMLPMAYQVILGPNHVTWRYPHPRAITRLILYPLPDLDQEVDCVLECYNRVLSQWEYHTFVKLPVNESREVALHVQAPEAIFSSIWRFRVLLQEPEVKKRFYFDLYKFLPKVDPWTLDSEPEHDVKWNNLVTGEQISGVLRVDSYFASKLAPKVKMSVRLAEFQVHAHNLVPELPSLSPTLEGYYVSKQLQRSHRVLSLIAQGGYLGAQLGSQAGSLFVFNTNLSCELLDCSSGTMDTAIESFQVHGGVSIPDDNVKRVRGRLSSGTMVMSLHVPRLRTLQALVADWQSTLIKLSKGNTKVIAEENNTIEQNTDDAAKLLEGRISLWIHNSCSIGFRIGQDETEEIIQIEPGVTLAYRWRKRSAPKRLRFAHATPVEDWQWSKSVPFVTGEARVRLERLETQSRGYPNPGECLYVEVKQVDAHRNMRLSGRLVLANMLRLDLSYKVRVHTSDNVWQSLASGQMPAEEINQSVMCSPTRDMVLKIKLMRQNTGWSGDIPLKECPKENVPWLVKVPSEGDMPYMSVWCRVVKARGDGRILATIWPLYVLQSSLTLDTDLLLTTEIGVTSSDVHTSETAGKPPPIVQTAPGRGASTHLIAPGTTSAKHSLSFQYRNIECPVTRESIPLHYGVTERSVFDKRIPVNTLDEVAQEIAAWLTRSGRLAVSDWPYSLVTKHWQGQWRSALLQPRCEVVVRYEAIRAGGGCSLEVHLSPVLLLCNAAPMSLTLRAHDAAPVCKLEPGNVISPPTVILKKPFFMSYELDRETFVSQELEVYAQDPGRYGSPPEGKVAVDHPTIFVIQCSNKVALLNLHYEIKDDINILGITSTFVLKNDLKCSILISPIAVPIDKGTTRIVPRFYKSLPPAGSGTSSEMFPMCMFWLRERWQGWKVSELMTFMCLALETKEEVYKSVPVRLGAGHTRVAVALVDENYKSTPVVVTQHKYEGQWVVTISEDPCPQFLIYNQTYADFAVALPIPDYEDKEKSKDVKVVADYPGARWWCVVKSLTSTYYSTPDHCLKRSPAEEHHIHPVSLSFGNFRDVHTDPSWCPPVAITDGEQLVRIDQRVTIKIRVKNNPHTTIIELQDVSENDLSASVIRGRLMGLVPRESTSEARPKHLRVQPDVFDSDETYENPNTSTAVGEDTISGVTTLTISKPDNASSESSSVAIQEMSREWHTTEESELIQCVMSGIVIKLSAANDTPALLALHVDNIAVQICASHQKLRTNVTVENIQLDNLQYDSGQFDFAVIATTEVEPHVSRQWAATCNIFADQQFFVLSENQRIMLRTCHDTWTVDDIVLQELTEVEIMAGPLALYVEDAYVKALAELFRMLATSNKIDDEAVMMAEALALQRPLRLRLLYIHPLDLTLTLHTAVRIYIALDQSPLHLSAFKIQNMFTSPDRLAHALTVHYLSAAILGAGWVVGGLELLGAPGALAARVGGATGGVRGVASAAAAALLRSLSAWAGSLARNLDLLAGDEEHARRAAAARRRPPDSFMGGLAAGITNFAINILGAVGGLAHHPLVGVAVGESESGTTALRRGLLGALTKPLSATADLVAYAGNGLLKQTGWDPVPQPRASSAEIEESPRGWRRESVRWTFLLPDLLVYNGYEVLLDNCQLLLMLTQQYIIFGNPANDCVVEMIDLRNCKLGTCQCSIVELFVTQKQKEDKASHPADEEEEMDHQARAAVMARVARYMGTEGASTSEGRTLYILPLLGDTYNLHAALTTAIRNNAQTHFSLI